MTIPRLFQAPNRSFFLLGPRGVGKSTYLRNTFPDAHVIDLLSEATFQSLLANPDCWPLNCAPYRMGNG